MKHERWPELPDDWQATYATLHMWTQVVGKIALARAAAVNHSWGVALQITSRGLATRPLASGERTFMIEFDFISHELRIAASDGAVDVLPLVPQSVAAFYESLMHTLTRMELPVRIWPMPVEIPSPVRFDHDTLHSSYDPERANRFWRIVVQCERVFSRARCPFIGKASPVHFFWGSFDVAVTRFSGRAAPPRDGPSFMREAYSHEVISHGFWPGAGAKSAFGPGPVEEAVFYAYAAPVPPGIERLPVAPPTASYNPALGEFILPYAAVRASPDPEHTLRQFVDSTYEQMASLAGWDRAALERGTQARADSSHPERRVP
jgi:hypothetical protein